MSMYSKSTAIIPYASYSKSTAIIPYSSQTSSEFIHAEVKKWWTKQNDQKIKFISIVCLNAFFNAWNVSSKKEETQNGKTDLKNRNIKPVKDYRDTVPMIRKKIVQQENEDWKIYDRKVNEFAIENSRAGYDGPVPEYPAKPLPNLLYIHDCCSLLQKTEKYSFRDERRTIETGNLIHEALKKYNLEAFYFNEFKKIIVLSSSNISQKILMLIFEKFDFNTGFYPIVENERTQFGDLMIHISDKFPALVQPIFLSKKDKIFNHLSNDKIIKDYIPNHILQFIAEKFEYIEYIPQETLKNIDPASLPNNVVLKPFDIDLLDIALRRCAKGFPPRK